MLPAHLGHAFIMQVMQSLQFCLARLGLLDIAKHLFGRRKQFALLPLIFLDASGFRVPFLLAPTFLFFLDKT